MKTKTVILVFSSIIGLSIIFGFSKDKKKEKIGDFVFIPMGSTTINDKVVSLDSYWISDHEITNKEYNEFLTDLKNNGKTKEFEICKIDTIQWAKQAGDKLYPLVKFYSTHPAYDRYPVLNISYEAAQLYCEWLTDKNEDKTQVFRLPTKEEWIYAAAGGLEHTNYSWGMYLRNKKGEFMCNFKHIGDEYIHSDLENNLSIIPEYVNKDNSTSSPVDSYWANEYGLYNACGNVAEMIDRKGIAMGGSWNSTGYDVQITSELEYFAPNPFVGFRPVRVTKK